MKGISLILIIMMTIQIQAQSKKQKAHPKINVSVDVKSKLSSQQTFEYIVPIDLEHIFNRYKNIPAVKGTSNEKPWYKPGMTRTVHFDDGTSSEETLLSVIPHTGFTYKVNGFTTPLGSLIKQINGAWRFKKSDSGNIRVEWTYEFIPKNFFYSIIDQFNCKKKGKNINDQRIEHYQNRIRKWSIISI
ncbi:MAG: hypothetical protein MRY83_20070 [Flavobacteriales bacterium]|nr:hypothetical protein [Flavobacteriales bacterium]